MKEAPTLAESEETDLPEGWDARSIGALFDCWGGMTPSTSINDYWDGVIPWVSSKDVKSWRVSRGTEFVTQRALNETRLRKCRPGTVLTVVRSGVLAHTLPVAITTAELVVNQDVKALDSGSDQLNEWLARYLQAHQREILEENRKDGTTVQSIRVEQLLKRLIPIPPLAEQKRIVAKVEELLAHINAARERLARLPAILKRFRQSVLAAACSGRLTEGWRANFDRSADSIPAELSKARDRRGVKHSNSNLDGTDDALEVPAGWLSAPCSELCHPERALTYGVIKLGPPVPAGVATLRSSDVRWLKIDERDIKRISPEIAAEYGRTTLTGGEILVTVRGTLGGVAVVPARMAGFNVSREVAVVPIEPLLNPRFFAFAIASKQSQNWLAGMEKGVAYTGINIEDLKRLPLPIPSLEEQAEIVRRVDALFALADAIEAKLASATARADALTQSILAKAFRGELVETEASLARREDRPYEPATVLLERIHHAKVVADGAVGIHVKRPRDRKKAKS